MANEIVGIYNHETGLNETREMTDPEQADLVAFRQEMKNLTEIPTADE
jgi:hypothetical protein